MVVRVARQQCTICKHPKRAVLDQALASGIGYKSLSKKHGVSKFALYRHKRAHLSPEMRTAAARKMLKREGDLRAILLEEGTSLVEQLGAFRAQLYDTFVIAKEIGDLKAAAHLGSRIHDNFTLVAKLTGELLPHSSVNVTNLLLSPDYQRIRSQLLRALSSHPEAAADVAEIFRQAGAEAVALIEAETPRVINGG